jgi:hypothetical protein
VAVLQGNAKQGSVRGFYPKTIEGSLRFNDDDSAYLTWTAGTPTNRKKFTFSCWVKRGLVNITAEKGLFSAGTDNSNHTNFGFGTDTDTLQFQHRPGDASGGHVFYRSTAKYSDPSAWYHIVLEIDTTQASASNRIKVYVNGVQDTTFVLQSGKDEIQLNEEFQINESGKLHTLASRKITSIDSFHDGYLAEVHFTDGTAYTADAFGELKNGVWVAKTPDVTYGTNGFYLNFQDDTEVEAFNTVLWRGNGTGQSITGMGFQPDLVWFKSRSTTFNHQLQDAIRGVGNVLFSNLTNGDSSYPNTITSLDADGFTLGSDAGANQSGQTYVGWGWDAGANNAVTGHSSVTYTGNGSTQKISGFPFSPDMIWIKERSSTSSHRIHDTVRGPQARLFPDNTNAESSSSTSVSSFDSNGFTVLTDGGVNENNQTYVAWAWDAGDSDPVSNTNGSITSTVKASTTNGFSIVSYTGNGSASQTVGHGLGSAPTGYMVIIKNRTDTGPSWQVWHSGNGGVRLKLDTTDGDFGNLALTFGTDTLTLPSGNSASWDTLNKDYITYCWHDVTGKQKFGSYTGTGASGNTVTTGFRPGFLMIKRTDSTSNWMIVDASRSPFNEADTALFANATSTDQDLSAYGMFEFTDTGFVVNDNGTLSGTTSTNINNATYIYAAFAGSYSDYITDYNTDGSIDSRVKANDTTGFSIVSYEGTGSAATVGHGLSSTPEMLIIKARNTTTGWSVNHVSTGMTSGYLQLQSTAAFASAANNVTGVSSSTFTLGNDSWVNASGQPFICYAFHSVDGYSKFGSYTGNGSSTGPSVTGLGFKPAFMIIKRTDVANSWYLVDNTRDTTNPISVELEANNTGVEGTGIDRIDFNSDGFQIKTSGAAYNASGGTYIYAAFADTREAAFWLDQSGNDNDWQPVNLDHNDTVADSPTDNFATFNPLAIAKYNATGFRTLGTFSDGNLTLTTNADNESGTVTFGASSGKYYMEFTSVNLAQRQQIIVYSTDDYRSDTGAVTTSSDGGGNATDRVSWTTGDVIGIAVDIDSNKVWFHKNGDWFGTSNPSTPTGGDTLNAFTGVGVRQDSGSTGNAIISFNAGQQPFKYDPPA